MMRLGKTGDVVILTCEICKEPFEFVVRPVPRKKVCSDKCEKERMRRYDRKRRRNKRKKEENKWLQCATCVHEDFCRECVLNKLPVNCEIETWQLDWYKLSERGQIGVVG